jgi:putative inorganic carbon (hco3(-)) transporter
MDLALNMATSYASPAELGNTAAAADKTKELKGLAIKLVVIYAFFLSSRSFEILTQITGRNLFIILVLSAIGLFLVFAKGTFTEAAKSPAGTLLLAFTGWAMVTLPFSSWRSASLGELVNTWSKSVAAYFIIVGLATSLPVVRKVYLALGWGAVASTLLIFKFGWYDGGRLTGFGSLANSNEVAFHLVVGLPFLLLVISRSKVAWKVGLSVIVLMALRLSLKTASRSGLIMLGVIFAVSFLRVSTGAKFKMAVVGVIALIVGIGSLSQDQMDRYATLFSSDDTSAAAQSARLSQEERRHKLDEAIELTLTHPIFGVGMGAFIPSSTALEDSKGEKEVWIAPHNSYAQVSSETGFLGVILFVAVLGYCFRSLLKLDKTAKRLGLTELRSMALCMLLSLCVMSIHFMFDAIAYQFYLPMIAGLSTILINNSKPLIEAAEAQAAGTPLSADSESPEAAAEMALAGAGTDVRNPKMLSGPLQTGRPPIPRSQNPYRFGRRRFDS